MTVRTLDSVAYFYVSPLALPSVLIPNIATTQVHPPTRASPISDPASLSATRVHSPTWASLFSVPTCLLPTQSSLSLSVPVLLQAHLPTYLPPPFRFPRVCQGGPKFFFFRLLASPRLPPSLPSFVPCPPCTHLK